MSYSPPYTITPDIISLIEQIGELLGRLPALSRGSAPTPQLRRVNKIRSVQASLAIEGNTLEMEQVTAILDGKRVLGSPREVQEVRNALLAYDRAGMWVPHAMKDLLKAHEILMFGLVDRPGVFRTSGVGIQRGKKIMHVAPPAENVPFLVKDLLRWLKTSDAHPLIKSCVFHYEFEFIHPFSDGNGRMGRLWQTLILSKWKPVFGWLPVETMIREHQAGYYRALNMSNQSGGSTPFIQFMLDILSKSLRSQSATDQVTDQVSDQVKKTLSALSKGDNSAADLMRHLKLRHRPTFRKNYLDPALERGFLEMTQPDSPSSPTQKYRLTDKGRSLLKQQ